ncbi:MAG: hypothetical protein ACOYN0_14505 [Phycisphaerales bacterium]
MGTSNWQQIPFCIDALMKMAPSRVLDIGVGFGRWGIITREFCDVWYSRVFKEDWKVHIEGIEGFPKSITDYHASFYNKIHIGDAAELIPTLPGPWSVVIFGDVLEHFTKERANELLNICLDRAEYVLVNIPIGEDFEQGEAYGNAYERHLSQWWPEDFHPFGLVKHVLLKDHVGRPYGSFVLSRNDPKDLKSGLFSRGYDYEQPAPVAQAPDTAPIVARVKELAFELDYIKRSESYKMVSRLRRNKLLRAAKASLGSTGPALRVEVLSRPGQIGQGHEAWILGVSGAPGEPCVPWDYVDFEGEWVAHEAEHRPYGKCYMSKSGAASVRTGNDPVLTMMTHPWSGVVRVEFGGRSEIIDLSSPQTGQIELRPARTPMKTLALPPVATAPASPTVREVKPIPAPQRPFTAAERGFIESMKPQPDASVAVHCPKWLGVSSSTRILFANTYPVPADPSIDPYSITDADIEHHARALHASGALHVVFSGGDESHLKIAKRLRALRPEITVDLFWHGSYHQIGEEYVWHILKLWMAAVRSGDIRSILTCKAGMEDFFRSAGIPSSLLLNYVPGDVMQPPTVPASPMRAGLWLSGQNFRKAPYAMIAAMRMVGDVRIHGAGLDPAAMELIKELGLPAEEISPTPVSRSSLIEAIRRTHVSLYVTLSECCPMLPLESMQAGVPCLIGPCSHLFDDNSYLFDRLVVPFPDRADVIAKYFSRVVAERDEIIAEYARYAPRYNERARASVARWIAEGPSLARESELLTAAVR